MKLKQLALVTGTTLSVLLISSTKSQATTFLLQNAELVPPPVNADIGECSTAGLCQPGDILNLPYRPNNSGSVLAKNDSTFDFTKFIYTILPGQDAVWDPASTFSFFSSKDISADGKTLTLSDGVFAAGATARFSATNPGNTPVNVAVTFDGKRVPEPASVLGLLVFGAGGAASALKKKLATSQKSEA
jgi:hypothetical protein